MRNITTRFLLILLAWLLAACAPSAAQPIQTIAPADLATQTETPIPTQTVSPTPEFAIDLDKFHNFPESYEDLLANLDEFVESPDPLTDRAAFDRWFREKLVPALGPVEERPLNVNSNNNGYGRFEHRADADLRRMPLIRRPDFFYFESSGTIYPVPCFNGTNSAYPGRTTFTLCPIIFDGADVLEDGTSSLEKLFRADDLISYRVYIDLSYRSDVDWGILPSLMDALGDTYYDEINWIRFGFGSILFLKK